MDLRPVRLAAALAACALGGALTACGEKPEPTGTGAATAPPAPREPVSRQVLGEKRGPAGAMGHTLGLWRVEVQPGGRLPLHYHPGTQVAYVEEGRLTYTVMRGSVQVMRASGEGSTPVRRISAGQTATIGPGQWIVEERRVVHRAANRTQRRLVILLANLVQSGRPATIPLAQAGD